LGGIGVGDRSGMRQQSIVRGTILYGLPVFAYMYTVGSVGFWLPLYVRIHGFSYLEVQLLATVYFLVITPSTLLVGKLGDRSEHPNRIVAAGMVLNALAVTLMAHITESIPLMGVRVIQAIGLSTSFPIALGALSLYLGVSRGVGSNAFMMATGMAAGSIIGGILIELAGFEWMFYSAVLISLLAALLSLSTDFPKVRTGTGLIESLKKVPASVWVVLVGLLLRNTLATGVYSILAILFNQILGLSLLETAIALAVNPIVQAMASLYVADKVKHRELHFYSLAIASTSLVFILYYYTRSIELAIIAQILQGVTFAVINVAGNVYIISRIPETERYTASSLFNFAFNLGWVVGTVIAGLVMNAYGPIQWLKIAIILLPIVGLATFVAGKKLEGTSRAP